MPGATLLLVASIAGQPAAAASKGGEDPGNHLKITEVVVDLDTEILVIIGEQFDFGRSLTMILGDPGNVGDITSSCSADLLSIPQSIVCDLALRGRPVTRDRRARPARRG